MAAQDSCSGIILLGSVLLMLVLMKASAIENRPLEYLILEELPPNTLIGDVMTDAALDMKYENNVKKKLRFSFLTEPDFDRSYFTIEERTGIIRTTDKIDRDAICPQTPICLAKFDVAVQPVQYFQIIKVVVEILDQNDNEPTFPQNRLPLKISESTLPGTPFGIPAATDPDSASNAIKRYELKAKHNNKFELSVLTTADGETDLRLVLKDHLDREEENFYRCRVIAYDGARPPKSGVIHIDITVLDANDNDPKFQNETYEVNVMENIEVQSTIVRVQAIDPDEGLNGEIVYEFSKHTQQSYGHLFGIDESSGEVYIKGALDYEEGDIYLLSLTARDRGPDSLPAHASLIVRVQDENDNSPTITINTLTATGGAQVLENSRQGTFVAHISVVDHDKGSNGQFSCSLDDEHFHLQKLYATEYKIVTASVFDREQKDEYLCQLQCSDMGVPPQTAIQPIRVNILDANDHAPVFTQDMYITTIPENNRENAYLISVTANDLDVNENGKVWYEIEDEYTDIFNIDPTTGWITTRRKFDYETRVEYVFSVTARDSGSPSKYDVTKVSITVLDEDDEQPHFEQSAYQFGTFENQPPDTEIGTVVAKDADSPPYNKFTYSLDPRRSPTDLFRIDSITGKISTKKFLDREDESVYYLLAVATSDVNQDTSSTASVTIYVADQNDNSPHFKFPTLHNNTVRISNRAPIGAVIARLKATDRDTGVNAKLTYLIMAGNEKNSFTADPSTGAISVNTDLTGLDHELFVLTVLVKDEGETQHSVTEELNILVDRAVAYRQSSSLTFSNLFSGENLYIVIGFGAAAFIVIAIIIVAILLLRKRDRNHRDASAKEMEKMLPQPPHDEEHLQLKASAVPGQTQKYVHMEGGTLKKGVGGSHPGRGGGGGIPEANQLLMPNTHCHGSSIGSDEVNINVHRATGGDHDTDSGGSDSGRGPSSEEGENAHNQSTDSPLVANQKLSHLHPNSSQSSNKSVIPHVRFKKNINNNKQSPNGLSDSPVLGSTNPVAPSILQKQDTLKKQGILQRPFPNLVPPPCGELPEPDIINSTDQPSRNSVLRFDGEYVKYDLIDCDQESTV